MLTDIIYYTYENVVQHVTDSAFDFFTYIQEISEGNKCMNEIYMRIDI